MLKKIIFLSSALILSACATSPKGVSSEQFALTTKLTKGYNFTQLTGEKIHPINLTEKNGLLVMKAEATLEMRMGEKQLSTLTLNLQFLENYQRYHFARVGENSQKTDQRKETVRQCDDQCTITQYMVFSFKTDELIKAREQGLLFSVNKTNSSTDFIFKLPANYIDGLLKRYEAEKEVVMAPKKEMLNSHVAESKAIEMAKYWFNKIDGQEQVIFSTWAIKNSKENVILSEGSKGLEKLHYWYQEADNKGKKLLRIWSVENIK